jgi:hypothetical protein
MRRMPAPSASSWFARAWTPSVTSLSAGPPWGGLYLKPPSRGGLCDGVMTMPSASPAPAPPAAGDTAALNAMIARDSAGVGVYCPSAWTRVSTPFAASTSSAERSAGAEAACVSAPRNSGPVMPARARYSQIACVMARMWASLNAPSSAAPRWPLVPKATRSRGLSGSGRRS